MGDFETDAIGIGLQTCFVEQLPGLLRVEIVFVDIIGIEGSLRFRDRAGRDHPITEPDFVNDELTVDRMSQCLANIYLVEWEDVGC